MYIPLQDLTLTPKTKSIIGMYFEGCLGKLRKTFSTLIVWWHWGFFRGGYDRYIWWHEDCLRRQGANVGFCTNILMHYGFSTNIWLLGSAPIYKFYCCSKNKATDLATKSKYIRGVGDEVWQFPVVTNYLKHSASNTKLSKCLKCAQKSTWARFWHDRA